MPLVEEVLAGDPRAVARAATLIESEAAAGRELSKQLFSRTGQALTIGVTGPPGAGKSTLVNALIKGFRSSGKTVGVIAVDPSSPYSKGALLGDRVRMLEHYDDPGVFIRSMAARGRMGGLATATLDLMLLLDAAGRNVILVETVGVGQDELDIVHVADITVVVLAPGAGDDIQAMKAGLLEAADIIAINKADLPGADRLYDEILEAQHLSLEPSHPATLCKTSGLKHEGIADLIALVENARIHKHSSARNIHDWAHRLHQILRDDLLRSLLPERLHEHAIRVSEKTEDPHSAIMALKAELLNQTRDG